MSEQDLHVLIVEPKTAQQVWIRNALRSGAGQHCLFYEAATGADGLRLCQADRNPRLDVALVDLTLSDLRVVEFLHALKGDHALLPLPVIVLSDSLDDSDIPAAISAGAQDFLVKEELTPGLLARVVWAAIERHRLLQKLQASEAYFHALADSVPVLLWESDPGKECTFVNKHWLTFTGRRLEEELGTGWLAGVHPEDHSRSMQLYTQAFDTRQEFELEYRLRRHDGFYHWLLTQGAPRFTPDGTFLGYTGGCIDITERKEMEEALRQHEAQNRALIATMPDNVVRLNRSGSYLEVHLAGAMKLAYGEQVLVGRTLFDVMPVETAQMLLDAIHRAIDSGVTQTLEYVRVLNGKTFYLEAHIAASGNNDCVSVIRDVSERRQAEEIIRYQASLLDNVMDAIISTDLDYRIISWNRAAAALYGIASEEAIGKPLQTLVRIDYTEMNRQHVLEKFLSNGFWQGETIQYRRDGTPLYIFSSVTSIMDRNGKRIGAVAVNRDIAERKRTEQLLLNVQKYESVSRLAGGIAHDFNNLLTGVLGQVSLAVQKLPPGHEARIHIEKAVHSTQRAADLTRQLLAYTGQGAYHIEAVDLNRLIQDNLGLFEAVLPKQVRLEVALTPNLAAIEIDRGQAQQIVMNLVINAAEAITQGQGSILIETGETIITPGEAHHYLGVERVASGPYVYLKVIDNGTGMSEATLARIFDPYFTTKKAGSGLGLSATLGIVQRCKGGVQVTSQMGQGTTFCIVFPASDRPAAASPALQTEPHSFSATVLVIDDEASVREVISDILTTEGMRVIVARDGREGLLKYEERGAAIDLVLLDMKMPGMNGAQVFRALRTINPNLKIILSSGYLESNDTKDLAREPHATFLQKPYDLQKLLTTIQTLVKSPMKDE